MADDSRVRSPIASLSAQLRPRQSERSHLWKEPPPKGFLRRFLVTVGLERNRLGQKKCLPVTTGSDKNLPDVTPLCSPGPKKLFRCPSVTIGRDRSDVTPIFQPNHPQTFQKTLVHPAMKLPPYLRVYMRGFGPPITRSLKNLMKKGLSDGMRIKMPSSYS